MHRRCRRHHLLLHNGLLLLPLHTGRQLLPQQSQRPQVPVAQGCPIGYC